MTPHETVLLPGMLCDERVWHPVAERLDPARKVRIPRVDVADAVPALAREVLASLSGDPVAVVGFSFGGHVALEMLRQAPEAVAAVGVVGCGAGSMPAAEQGHFADLARRLGREAGCFDELRAPFAATMLGLHADPALCGTVDAMAASVGPTGWARQLAAQRTRPDSAATVATAGVPLFFGAGRHDTACPPERVAELAASAPGSPYVQGPRSGHSFPLEEPDILADALNDWLDHL